MKRERMQDRNINDDGMDEIGGASAGNAQAEPSQVGANLEEVGDGAAPAQTVTKKKKKKKKKKVPPASEAPPPTDEERV